MSVQAALQFIQAVRQDKAHLDLVRDLDQDAGLESLVQVGKLTGYEFTTDELYSAFKHDWSMRWVRYNSMPALK